MSTTRTDLLRPSASSLPSDHDSYDAWVDAQIAAFERVVGRALKWVQADPDGIPPEWFHIVDDDLVPMLAQIHFNASWLEVPEGGGPEWEATITEAAWTNAEASKPRLHQMAQEVWRAGQAMIAAANDPAAAAAQAAANEVLRATALGQRSAVEALPPSKQPISHEWRSKRDRAVRPDHKVADGQVVPLLTPFTVGGWPMMHPHDYNAPADQTANCRCVELFIYPAPVDEPAYMRPATQAERDAMKIPPAWRDVEISSRPEGVNGLVARGRDTKGRLQSRYSVEHTAAQSAKKYQRVTELVPHLDSLDARLAKDWRRDDTAAALQLIRRMGLRPGSTQNTRAAKQAYGATTLQARHVTVRRDGTTVFRFTGKDGVAIHLESTDPEVAKVIRSYKRGKHGEDRLFDTNPGKVNDYLHEVTGVAFHAKDLRTVRANAVAYREVRLMPNPTDQRSYDRQRMDVARAVSAELGNTPKIALDSYINPSVFARWEL